MNAVTAAGAPWYASGVHMWNGTADTLNAKPTSSRPSAIGQQRVAGALARHHHDDPVEPRRSGDAIGERDAVEKERARERAQQEILQRRLGAGPRIAANARQHIDASERTSSARKITSRSVAVAISIMPASANSMSA